MEGKNAGKDPDITLVGNFLANFQKMALLGNQGTGKRWLIKKAICQKPSDIVPLFRKSFETLPLTYAEPAHLAQVSPWEGAPPAGWGWCGWCAPTSHLASCRLKHFPIEKESGPLFIVTPNAFFSFRNWALLNRGFGSKCKYSQDSWHPAGALLGTEWVWSLFLTCTVYSPDSWRPAWALLGLLGTECWPEGTECWPEGTECWSGEELMSNLYIVQTDGTLHKLSWELTAGLVRSPGLP